MSNFAQFLALKNMKKFLFIIFCCFGAMIFGCKDSKPTIEATKSDADTTALTEPQIDTMATIVAACKMQSRLYTTEYRVHKVVLYDDQATIGGKLIDISVPGHRKAAIPIDVTLKGYVDFSNFTRDNVIVRDSLCIITLPDPKVMITASQVDHNGTRQYVSMTRKKFGNAEINALAAQGEDSIVSHIDQFGITERSREACLRAFMPMLRTLGYDEENVIIRFRKKFTADDLRPIRGVQD